MIKYIFSAFALFLGLTTIAQPGRGQMQGGGGADTPMIVGVVIDENNEPVPYAGIVIYNSADSSFVIGDATNEQGRFKVQVPAGNYYVKISFLSYDEKFIWNVAVTDKKVFLGKIALENSAVDLESTVIEVDRGQLELHTDKRVYNVGADLSNAGGSASDVLDNVPSVTVDVDGNIALRGSQNVRILIDGKPSGLTGMTPADALRTIPANMIDRVEVITNPSAKYDAEGEVGIINIILKKEEKKGINGSITTSGGYPDNYSAAYNLSYRTKKMNLFSSYGVSYRMSPGHGTSIQNFTGDTTYSYERIREHTRGGFGNNFRLGVDFYLNDRNSLTVSGLYSYSKGDNKSTLTYNDFDSTNVLTQQVIRTDNETEVNNNYEFTLSHKKTFKQKGREWTSDFRYIEGDDTENSDLFEKSNALGILPITQRSRNTEDQRTFFIQSDYVHPFTKDKRFEIGTRLNLREINNDYKVEQQDNSEQWFVLNGFDNNMIYTENIYAGYAIFANKLKYFSYQAGLRGEYSDIKTNLTKTNEVNPRNYFNLFPSLHLSRQLDSFNTIQLSYSRRLSRPGFRELLPFFTYSDSRNFFSGNPDLNPEYTDSYELGNLKLFKKGSILSSAYYRYRTGVTERITLTDSTGLIRTFPVNLSTQNAYGFEFNLNYRPTRWWRMTGNFNLYRAITTGEYKGRTYDADAISWTSRVTSKMELSKLSDFQLSFNYRAPQNSTQGKTLSMYSIDFGVSKQVMKKRGTIVLSVRDLMNSRKRRSITETDNLYYESVFQWRSRQFLATFSYRLDKDPATKKERPNNRDFQDGGGDDGGY